MTSHFEAGATVAQSVLNERYEQKVSLLQRAISAAGREIGDIPAVLDPARKKNGRRNLRLWIEDEPLAIPASVVVDLCG